MSELKKLREIYDLQLGVGPFPNEECQIAGIGGALHGNLIIYLADIAGIAERGEALQEVEDSTAQSFRKIVEKGFWERYPECKNRITATATPK